MIVFAVDVRPELGLDRPGGTFRQSLRVVLEPVLRVLLLQFVDRQETPRPPDSRTCVAQRIDPLAEQRIEMQRRTVEAPPRDADARERTPVGRSEQGVWRKPAWRRGEDRPGGVWIRRRVVRPDAPAVEIVVALLLAIGKDAVRALHFPEVGEFPPHAVLRLGIAHVARPVVLVPEAVFPDCRIPPEAAVRRDGAAADARAVLARRTKNRRLELDRAVPMPHDAALRLDDIVVDKKLTAAVDVNPRRRMRQIGRKGRV